MKQTEKLKRGDEYTCSACREVFRATRPDDEAMAEMGDIFGTTQDPAIVCDPCWRKMMGMPPARKARTRRAPR